MSHTHTHTHTHKHTLPTHSAMADGEELVIVAAGDVIGDQVVWVRAIAVVGLDGE